MGKQKFPAAASKHKRHLALPARKDLPRYLEILKRYRGLLLPLLLKLRIIRSKREQKAKNFLQPVWQRETQPKRLKKKNKWSNIACQLTISSTGVIRICDQKS